MKRIIPITTLVILFTLSISHKIYGHSYQDTITTRMDTVFCTLAGDTVTLVSVLDTSRYDFVWVKNNMLSDTLSFSNQLRLFKSDTIIRTSIPRDTIMSLIIDTITVRLQFSPVITLVLPSIECYSGMPINLVSNSVFDTTYIEEKITFFNILDQELFGIQYMKDIEKYKINLDNGDTIKVKLSYNSIGCPTIDTSFILGTKFLPQLDFHSDPVCFGDSTTVFNKSIFNKALSDVIISIEGITPDFTSKENFKCYIDSNGASRSMHVSINQQGCIQTGTYTINNKLKPLGNFLFDKTCENEKLIINNLSTATLGGFSISVSTVNKNYNYGSVNSMTIPDTFPDGTYQLGIIITNDNGCLDSSNYNVKIDPVTYVNFTGLEQYYCEKQDTSIIIGSQQGGSFQGLFINNLNPGRALFKPLYDVVNIPVIYTFTNSFGCTDTETKSVMRVHPKPELFLTGLLSAYCEKDAPTDLFINQNNNINSKYSIYRDGILITNSTGTDYLFDPIIPGQYRIVNYYIDQNNCFSEIENQTVVNPLPKIDLDPLVIIKPGDFITIGNNLQNESTVNYEWSNGDTNSSTKITQPGIYFLTATNTLTSCTKSDSIEIRYDKNIKEVLFNIKIYPNPTTDKIFIELNQAKSGIMLFRFNGNPAIINGLSNLSTDILGNLVINTENLEAGYYCLKIPDIGDFFILKM
jgi:hypothetical protein